MQANAKLDALADRGTPTLFWYHFFLTAHLNICYHKNRADTRQPPGAGSDKSPKRRISEMCEGYLIADRAAWERDMAELKIRAKAVADMGANDGTAVYEAFNLASNKILVQPAPDLEGVITKLELLFPEELASDLDVHDGHKTVVGDLRRAIAGCI